MNSSAGETVDVVIVAADTRELVLGCLDSLRGAPLALTTLVDNASRDGTAEAATQLFPDLDVVRLERSVGYPSACNRGAERGSAPLVLFLNDDVMATEGAVDELVWALESRPRAVAAGGRLVNPEDLTTQLRYKPKLFPTLASIFVQLTGLERIWPSNPISRRHSGAELDDSSIASVDQLAGACLLVRREVFDQVGRFDDGYWFWYDDVDLAQRLHQRGECLYVPGAPFRHLGGVGLGRWDRPPVVRSRFHGLMRYASTYFPVGPRLGLAATIVLVSLPRVAAFSLFRPELGRAWRAVLRGAIALARGREPGLR
jgi:GT2 family glycosyltransferase